jgi:Flp pilus assembly protein protease CpaA
MELLLLRQIILLAASAIAGYTDWKTGFIYDWLTLPLVGIGLVLGILEQNWIGIGFGITVFILLYGFYWLGKLGGGDVKLFTGIALMLPFYQNQIFLLPVLFFAALGAITFYSVYYLYRLKKEKIRVEWKKNQSEVLKGILFVALFSIYLFALVQVNGLSEWIAGMLWVPFLLAGVFVALEKPIKKNFFSKKVKLEELEEDEVIAMEFTDSEILEKTGLGLKGIIGKKEKEKLKEMGIKEVIIYANAPRFGPFIFIGVALGILFPEIISLFFLQI